MVDELQNFVVEHIKAAGSYGAVIVVLLIANITLWRAYWREWSRRTALADRLISMAEETTKMIERITGR